MFFSKQMGGKTPLLFLLLLSILILFPLVTGYDFGYNYIKKIYCPITGCIFETVVIGGPTGNLSIGTDGHISLNGNATVWDDMAIPITATGSGKFAPTLSNFRGGPVQLYTFSNAPLNSEDRVFGTLQMSHSYKLGTPIDCHVHFACGTNQTTNNVTWTLAVSKADIGGIFNVAQSYTATLECGEVYTHRLADFHNIGNFTYISGIANIMIMRNSTAASDTYTGNDAFALSLDCHHEKDSLGSNEEYTK